MHQVMGAASTPQPSTAPADTADGATPMQEGNDHDATAAINADGGLTEAQLLEIFKQTSVFNVRSALAGNEVLMGGAEEGFEHER